MIVTTEVLEASGKRNFPLGIPAAARVILHFKTGIFEDSLVHKTAKTVNFGQYLSKKKSIIWRKYDLY